MVVYQLECVACGELRIGRKTEEGEMRPVRDECPECGSSDYDVPACDSED
ncbi:hypothetical protein [Halorussus lipolyticus]|nr:hypothetical protein [Halorussus sp. DT80]